MIFKNLSRNSATKRPPGCENLPTAAGAPRKKCIECPYDFGKFNDSKNKITFLLWRLKGYVKANDQVHRCHMVDKLYCKGATDVVMSWYMP